MFCAHCGGQVWPDNNFCPRCGGRAGLNPEPATGPVPSVPRARPSSTATWIIGSVIAVIVLAGAAITYVLVDRNGAVAGHPNLAAQRSVTSPVATSPSNPPTAATTPTPVATPSPSP